MVSSGRFMRRTLKRVQLAAPARRERARLHHERRVAGDVVAIGCMSDVADMEMTGQKQICADRGKTLHRDRRAADQVLGTHSFGEIERVGVSRSP